MVPWPRRCDRHATLGTFIGSASPIAAEVCAAAGVDWVLLDLEHGAAGRSRSATWCPPPGATASPPWSG
jgi:2,4-dihydroxyhept-2-ene-1,7-dioic acid aldolase